MKKLQKKKQKKSQKQSGTKKLTDKLKNSKYFFKFLLCLIYIIYFWFSKETDFTFDIIISILINTIIVAVYDYAINEIDGNTIDLEKEKLSNIINFNVAYISLKLTDKLLDIATIIFKTITNFTLQVSSEIFELSNIILPNIDYFKYVHYYFFQLTLNKLPILRVAHLVTDFPFLLKTFISILLTLILRYIINNVKENIIKKHKKNQGT
ncbi:hypothetical protein ACTGV6_07005 [Streptococcus suis]|uniref:hypothetical protein n=1 Tax=Streptococcus suis TaxID=1307 RepID=UPI00192D58BF|nr:hypothetical protein [Streptococcus suis]MBL6504344.1 hypothetical protein [Streptococcus suis]MBM0241961.1 hypothetical protein [Streptococcus suis]MBM7205102.1 hypothetical protein [Streptococcus suis]MBM7282457.1 hypothetical protein [Streptococcus suis]MBO4135974.1 hypothetical protein [Streptococcus suis]